MKLLYVLNTFVRGGKERRCLEIVQGLLRLERYEIQIVVIDGDIEYEELYNCNVTIHTLHRLENGLSAFRILLKLHKIFKEFKPDIVHGWGAMSDLFVFPLSFIYKFVFLSSIADTMTPHTFVGRCANWLSCHRCSHVVGNSIAGLNAYSVPEAKAVCIYNGFNEERFKVKANVGQLKQDLGISTYYVVTMVAAFCQYKDWTCFVRSAQSILAKRKDITFLGIGSGPDWNFINSIIADDERPFIKLLGVRNDVDQLIQMTDISVLCSNVNTKEGLSNSILESMAWGVPVIATSGGGTPEIIEDGKNGLLISEQTPEAVKALIEKLIDDRKLREKLSIEAEKTVREKFLLSDKILLYDDLYRKVNTRS